MYYKYFATVASTHYQCAAIIIKLPYTSPIKSGTTTFHSQAVDSGLEKPRFLEKMCRVFLLTFKAFKSFF